MFFILSKTIGILTLPTKFITLLAAIGVVLLMTRFSRAGRRILLVCLALVLIIGCLPVGRAMTLVLEHRFPRWTASGNPPDGMIVLGGAIDADASAYYGMVAISGSAERLTETAKLARQFPNARIVFSGGNPSLLHSGPAEAAFVPELFESFGIARSRLMLEDRSRNTVENARFTKALVEPKPGERWLLITSAIHMPRAMGSFRKAGFPVEAYPVDWHTRGWGDLLRLSPWPLNGLGAADAAAKEWVGLVAYWLAGNTSELLPGAAANPAAAPVPADKRP